MFNRVQSLIFQCHSFLNPSRYSSDQPNHQTRSFKDLPFEMITTIFSFTPPQCFLRASLLNKSFKEKCEDPNLSNFIWKIYCQSKKWEPSHASLTWKEVYQYNHIFVSKTLPAIAKQRHKQTSFIFGDKPRHLVVKKKTLYFTIDGNSFWIDLTNPTCCSPTGEFTDDPRDQAIDFNRYLILKIKLQKNISSSYQVLSYRECYNFQALETFKRVFPEDKNNPRKIYCVEDKFIVICQHLEKNPQPVCRYDVEIRKENGTLLNSLLSKTVHSEQEDYDYFECMDVSSDILAFVPGDAHEIILYHLKKEWTRTLAHPESIAKTPKRYFYQIAVKNELIAALGINKKNKPVIYIWNWNSEKLLSEFDLPFFSDSESDNFYKLSKTYLKIENNLLFVVTPSHLHAWNLEDGKNKAVIELNIDDEKIEGFTFTEKQLIIKTFKRIHIFRFDDSTKKSFTPPQKVIFYSPTKSNNE